MATRFVLTPESAHFPGSNFPAFEFVNDRPVLSYDAGTDETAYWQAVLPDGWTGTITAVITYMMASATANEVIFNVSVEAVTDGDATDLDAGTSFDTANASSATTVPGTAGYIDQITVTLTNNDSSAAGDYVRFQLTRDADNAGDDATGDCHVLGVRIDDGA